jgi:hypothetical protein
MQLMSSCLNDYSSVAHNPEYIDFDVIKQNDSKHFTFHDYCVKRNYINSISNTINERDSSLDKLSSTTTALPPPLPQSQPYQNTSNSSSISSSIPLVNNLNTTSNYQKSYNVDCSNNMQHDNQTIDSTSTEESVSSGFSTSTFDDRQTYV